MVVQKIYFDVSKPKGAEGKPKVQEEKPKVQEGKHEVQEGGKLTKRKPKGANRKRKSVSKSVAKSVSKSIAKSVAKSDVKSFNFRVPSTYTDIRMIDLPRTEILDRPEKLKPIDPSFIPTFKVEGKPKKFFTDFDEKLLQTLETQARADYQPVRAVDLQFSGLPTLEEYEANPSAFAGLTQPQKDELDRQVRQSKEQSKFYLEDIANEIKKIVPALQLHQQGVVPDASGIGVVEPPFEFQLPGARVVSPPGSPPPSASPPRRPPLFATSRQDKVDLISSLINDLETSTGTAFDDDRGSDHKALLTLYRQKTNNKSAKLTKSIVREATYQRGVGQPVGSGLSTMRKGRGRPHKLAKASAEQLQKAYAHYKKLQKKHKKGIITMIQLKKLHKYQKLEGAGFFDTLKSLGKDVLKKGVEYALENPDVIKSVAEKGLTFLKKKL